MRVAAYSWVSVSLAIGVIFRAFNERPNFYSAMVYLAQSNAALMILANFVLMCMVGIVFALQRLFYGPLRPIEVEQLYEKGWYALTETCLAMGIFRDEVGMWFLFMLATLLACKVWGWIGEGRREILEQQPPANPRLFHARLASSLVLSMLINYALLRYCVKTVVDQDRPGMMVMFAFEYAILIITSASTFTRYLVSVQEILVIKQQTEAKIAERKAEVRAQRQEAERRAASSSAEDANAALANLPSEDDVDENDIETAGWEAKGRWMFYVDLVTDFLKLTLYLFFFAAITTFHGVPIHIVRDVFLTMRSFLKRLSDFARYRNLTKDMNSRYPDATVEELARESTCIVCREEMLPWHESTGSDALAERSEAGTTRPTRTTLEERLRAKKLPCGHVLHVGCLRSWLERQQVCPICRRPVTAQRQPVGNVQGQQGPPGLPQLPGGNQQPPLRPQPLGAQGQLPDQRPNDRLRTINFGPLRFTYGRVHGGEEQLRRIRDAVSNPYGVSSAGGPHLTGAASVQSQLQAIEQHIMREIQALGRAQHQLANVRALQGELDRLRMLQAANMGAASNTLQAAAATWQYPNATGYGGTQGAPQAYVPNAQQQMMGPGLQDLPQGMTLPEGWSLMPLQRVGPPQNNVMPFAPALVQHNAPFPSQSQQQQQQQQPTQTPNMSQQPPGPRQTSQSNDTEQAAQLSNTIDPGAQEQTNLDQTNGPLSFPVSSTRQEATGGGPAETSSEQSAFAPSISSDSSAQNRPITSTRDGTSANDAPQNPTSLSLPEWANKGNESASQLRINAFMPATDNTNGDRAGGSRDGNPSQDKGKGKSKVPTVEDAPDEDLD